MNFCSDNVSGASPEIIAAVIAANEGTAMPYGNDEYTQRFEAKLKDIFETDLVAFPVATGSAANALALSVMTPPYGAIYCHPNAHINVDECGAPEFYTGGAKLVTIPGDRGKIPIEDLAQILLHSGAGVVHHVQPAAVSITQATEAGTVYSVEEVKAIANLTHSHNLTLHMDGARFANAVVSLGCSPAEITWKAGVDVLSFGATKNGALAAEAVIFFNTELAKTFAYRRKRSGHLFSKMRFLSAQLEAYITNNLWLKNATHANQLAAKITQELTSLLGVKLYYPVDVNEIFIELPETVIQNLLADGFQFYRWDHEASTTIRLIAAFNTKEEDVTAFIEATKRHLKTVQVGEYAMSQ